jgi:ribose transport system ATP-binding protein
MAYVSSSARPELKATMDSALTARGVGKTFPAGVALRDFDFDIAPGEIHALVGENGSGKSTFVKILAGYHQPDAGSSILVGGDELSYGHPQSSYERGCRFVHQDLALVDQLTVADNFSLSAGFPTRVGTVRSRALERSTTEALQRVGLSLSPGTLVGDLSPAHRTGVAIARALLPDSRWHTRLVVMDEPTATLPEYEVEHLLKIVRAVAAQGIGVLYVSHRLDEIFDLSGRITVLRDGVRVGTFHTGDLTRSELVTLIVGQEITATQRSAEADIRVDAADIAALRIEGLRTPQIVDLTLHVDPGSITGLAGLTGSGRETALAAVFGSLERDAGRVFVDGRPVGASPGASIKERLGYLPPDRKKLGAASGHSARENITILDLQPFWRRLHLSKRRELLEVSAWFDRLQVRPTSFEKTFETFSGGNQQKLLFAKWMRMQPRVLMLDEPTQGVDVGARALLHQQLIAFAASGQSVLVSSSDNEELIALCGRVLVMRHGAVVADLSGAALTAANVAHHSLGPEEIEVRVQT